MPLPDSGGRPAGLARNSATHGRGQAPLASSPPVCFRPLSLQALPLGNLTHTHSPVSAICTQGPCLSRLCLPSLPASSSPRKKERITKPQPCRVFSCLPDSLSRRLPLLRISSCPYLTLQTPAHPSRPHLSVASVRAFPGLAPGQALLGSPPSLHLPQQTSVV